MREGEDSEGGWEEGEEDEEGRRGRDSMSSRAGETWSRCVKTMC